MEVTETPRDISFCTHAVRDEEPLIVPDATQDPRFSGNPLVVGDPQIRFYAGIPLFTQDGLAVGTLCAIDRRPRQLRYESLEALEDFACLAQDLINGRELLIRRRECVAYAAERDRLLQETVEAIPLGIVRASPAGKLREANVWTCDLLKCDLDTLLDHDIRDLIHPDDWTAHGVEIERVMAGTTGSHKAKLRVVRHDGSAVAVHVSFCLKRRGSGRPGYVLMLLDDRCADPLRRKSTD
jgi:PAS domain S-box-containing protein